MVKELSMDNSIFSLGAGKAETKFSDLSSANSNTAEFETTFETAKNNSDYTDKTDLKPNNENVVKVAEKSVNRKEKSSDNTADNITKVNKKVSNRLTTKSPRTATSVGNEQGLSNAQDPVTAQNSGIKITEDACTFSVKEDLNSSSDVATDFGTTVEVAENSLSVEQNSQAPVETVIPQDTTSTETLESAVEQVVTDDLELTEDTVATLTSGSSKNIVELQPVAQPVAEPVETNSESVVAQKSVESETSEFAETSQETSVKSSIGLKSQIQQTVISDLVTDVQSETVLDTTSEDFTQTGTDSSTVVLDENWVAVEEDEAAEILKEIDLTQLPESNDVTTPEPDMVSKEVQVDIPTVSQEVLEGSSVTTDKVAQANESVVDTELVDDVEDETMIGATAELADDTIVKAEIETVVEGETTTEVDATVTADVKVLQSETSETEPVLVEQDIPSKDEKAVLSDNNAKVGKDVSTLFEDGDVEPETNFNKMAGTIDTTIDETLQQDVMQNTQSELELVDEQASLEYSEFNQVELEDVENVSSISLQVNQEVETKSISNNSQKVADAVEKIATTTRPAASSKDEDDEEDDDSTAADLLLSEVEDVAETETIPEVEIESEMLATDEKSFTKSEEGTSSESYINEDLDIYIDNCIKMAFVDTTTQTDGEEVDVISALETKFEETLSQEEDFDYEVMDTELESEYENITSLEELVDVEEVETMGLRLKESSYSSVADKSVSSVSASTTTEQLIRYSIEGESSLNSTTQLEFSKFAPESLKTAQPEVSGKEVLAQISEKLSTFSFKAGSKLTMQLNPENLGKIELTLRNTTEGIIAEMTASSDDAADMLKKNLDDLKETLQKYGVRFDNVSVKTSATQQGAQGQDYTQQEGSQKQQHEQKRDGERHDKKQFDDMMNSFTEEDKE